MEIVFAVCLLPILIILIWVIGKVRNLSKLETSIERLKIDMTTLKNRFDQAVMLLGNKYERKSMHTYVRDILKFLDVEYETPDTTPKLIKKSK